MNNNQKTSPTMVKPSAKPKLVKIFGTVYEYNPVTKTYSTPTNKQR